MAKKSKSFYYDKNVQARNWNLLTYCSKSRIDEVLELHKDIIRAYAYIYHDKFTDEELDGKDKKEPHFHIVLRLTMPLKSCTVQNWFYEFNIDGSRINTRLKPCDNYKEDFEYLTHKNHPNKYQFPKSAVVCNNHSAFRSKRNCSDDLAIDALEDMLSGVSVYDIAMRYGRDVIYHMSQIKYTRDLIVYGIDTPNRDLSFLTPKKFEDLAVEYKKINDLKEF